MEFYIDLRKGVMNFAKLVKKAVQVRGKNGKVFTRMQWVSPMDASDGMGVRKISSKQGWENAKKDGIHNHPDYHAALKDQGVHEDTFEDHHPHFFLPESEESYNNHMDRLDEMQHKHGQGEVMKEGFHAASYMHEEHIPDDEHPVYNEHEFVPHDFDEHAEDKFLRDHGLHPEIHAISEKIGKLDLDGHKYSYKKLEEISHEIGKHWVNTIKPQVEQRIKEDLPEDDPDTKFIRNVQLGALKNGDMNHNLNMSQHPIIARAAVDKILGKGVADKFRSHIEKACLSVNFPGKNRERIEKEGYKSSQLEDYIRREIGEEGVEKLHKILDKHNGTKKQIDAIHKLVMKGGESYSWNDVRQRADAEYNAIGLELEDRKPTYIALNPNHRDTGAATYYGNRWLKVDNSVLKHCTATFDDSFNTSKSVAKVWSMEHLKDMFILKQLDRGTDTGVNDDSWVNSWGEIPIELQYHKPELSTDQFEVMPDPADAARQNVGISDDDLIQSVKDTFTSVGIGNMTDTGKTIPKDGVKNTMWKTDSGHWVVTSPPDEHGSVKVGLYVKDPWLAGQPIVTKTIQPKSNDSDESDYDDDDLFGGNDDDDDDEEFYLEDDDDYDDLDMSDDEMDELLKDTDEYDDLDFEDDDSDFKDTPYANDSVMNDGSFSADHYDAMSHKIHDHFGSENLDGLKHEGNNQWSTLTGGKVTTSEPKDGKVYMTFHKPHSVKKTQVTLNAKDVAKLNDKLSDNY